jgi:hypothetical protein
MISPWTKPGTKVACIRADADFIPRLDFYVNDNDMGELEEGAIYTVSNVLYDDLDNLFTVLLDEIPVRSPPGDDWGYSISRFRLAELPSCLTELLNAAPVDGKVSA